MTHLDKCGMDWVADMSCPFWECYWHAPPDTYIPFLHVCPSSSLCSCDVFSFCFSFQQRKSVSDRPQVTTTFPLKLKDKHHDTEKTVVSKSWPHDKRRSQVFLVLYSVFLSVCLYVCYTLCLSLLFVFCQITLGDWSKKFTGTPVSNTVTKGFVPTTESGTFQFSVMVCKLVFCPITHWSFK